VSIWSSKVDTLHDCHVSRHETHQFSLCQRGSEAFHDPQLQTHVAHAVTNTRLIFLLLVSASVCYIGCHCGVCLRVQTDNSILFDWILSCVCQPLDACVCSVQHAAPCNLQRATHWRGLGGLLLFELGGKRRAFSTKHHAPNQAISSDNGFIVLFNAHDCGPLLN